jgi:sec-independent protein translocase protein TatB
MFDLFSWSHILILLVVALVVVGPKDLPRMLHMMGKWAGKARAMANEFKSSFDEMARQQELDELRKELDGLRASQTVDDIQAEINRPVEIAAVETGPEPRVGEFQVTDTKPDAPKPVMAGEPPAP